MSDVQQTFERAVAQYRAGKLSEAQSLYEAVVSAAPDHADALHMLGLIAQQGGNAGAAAQLIERAISINPRVARFHANLGLVYVCAGRYESAIEAFERTIAIHPNQPRVYNDLGVALQRIGRSQQAIDAFQRAIALRPGFPNVYTNLGAALREMDRDDQALAAFRRASALAPDDPEPRRLLGLLLLSRGEFREGFAAYEAHRQIREFKPLQEFTQPAWEGEPLRGRTLLVHADQGFGDTIQMARYLPLICGAQRVILQCQRALKRLMQHSFTEFAVIGPDESLPAFDVHCPITSLPRVMGTTVDSIPGGIPYLDADPREREIWRSRLGGDATTLNVGLIWSGRPDPPGRSIPFSMLKPLAHSCGVRFHGLKPREAADEWDELPQVADWSAYLRDFADTAALMCNLDLIISIDTAAVHLAGALGRPVWVMLNQRADWRWLRDRADTPWYRTMRLFRQPRRGDWQPLVETVAAELANFAPAR